MAVVAAVLVLSHVPANAQQVQPAALSRGSADDIDRARPSREYLIKAAILYNLTKFATWPEIAFPSPAAPVRVCILGQNPFGGALETLQGKQVGQRNLNLSAIADIDLAAGCHVLFVSASEEPRLPTILDVLADLPVLTVADIDRFANAGGIVGLTKVEDRSGLEVNVDAASQAGLKLSSKLLRLAVTVDTQSARLGTPPVDAATSQ